MKKRDEKFRASAGLLLAQVEATSDAMDRRDASGWLVICINLETVQHGSGDCVVSCYGPFATPEAALIEAQRHADNSLPVDDNDAGWGHYIKPLYPPVFEAEPCG